MLEQKLKFETQKLKNKLLNQVNKSKKEIAAGKGKILKSLKDLR